MFGQGYGQILPNFTHLHVHIPGNWEPLFPCVYSVVSGSRSQVISPVKLT